MIPTSPTDGARRKRPLVGISTGILADRFDLDALLAFDPEIVEFYNYPSGSLRDIEAFCTRNQIVPALHTPVPYDGMEPLRRFSPTDPDAEIQAMALRLASATVRTAAELGALHVVVHFPSPYPPFEDTIPETRCRAFLEPLSELAARLGVRVLLENMSSPPALCSPHRYRSLLERYPGYGFCLDLGHSHLLSLRHPMRAYIRTLGRDIRSVHFYNTTADRYPTHGHELPQPGQLPEDGWIDLPDALISLREETALQALVLEPKALTEGNLATSLTSIDWLRSSVKETWNGQRNR